MNIDLSNSAFAAFLRKRFSFPVHETLSTRLTLPECEHFFLGSVPSGLLNGVYLEIEHERSEENIFVASIGVYRGKGAKIMPFGVIEYLITAYADGKTIIEVEAYIYPLHNFVLLWLGILVMVSIGTVLQSFMYARFLEYAPEITVNPTPLVFLLLGTSVFVILTPKALEARLQVMEYVRQGLKAYPANKVYSESRDVE